jgi:hypothetical protein
MAKKQYFDLEPGQWVHDYQGLFHILDNTGDRIYYDWYDDSGKLIARNTSLAAVTMRKHEDEYGLRLAMEAERDRCLRRGGATEEQTLARLLKEVAFSLGGERISEPDLHDLLRYLQERNDPRASQVREIQRQLEEAWSAFRQIRSQAFRDIVFLAPEALSREIGLSIEGPFGPPDS